MGLLGVSSNIKVPFQIKALFYSPISAIRGDYLRVLVGIYRINHRVILGVS